MNQKELSLRECAFEDAKRHGSSAVAELTEKCKKRARVKQSRRASNCAIRDNRNAELLSKGGK